MFTMIIFYKTTDCPRCARVEEILEELAIAHDTVNGTASEVQQQLPKGVHPPTLIDDGEIFEGADAILEHLAEVEGFVEMWRKYQSDACYCEEEEGT